MWSLIRTPHDTDDNPRSTERFSFVDSLSKPPNTSTALFLRFKAGKTSLMKTPSLLRSESARLGESARPTRGGQAVLCSIMNRWGVVDDPMVFSSPFHARYKHHRRLRHAKSHRHNRLGGRASSFSAVKRRRSPETVGKRECVDPIWCSRS